MDIHETSDHYIVTAEVPGMSREDLDIRVHEGRLTISGVAASGRPSASSFTASNAATAASAARFQFPFPWMANA